MDLKKRLTRAMVLCSLLLGIKDGYLALWKEEDPQPVQRFPVRVSSLPAADQLRLSRGIRVESREALLALLEDYL